MDHVHQLNYGHLPLPMTKEVIDDLGVSDTAFSVDDS